mmetsp:Transcript_2127/g.7945  ORF Transcript_2127/g.7945 Transcript_2127/m.7945 type:complete len:347 (-) Transcript_2127:257-1297(-)
MRRFKPRRVGFVPLFCISLALALFLQKVTSLASTSSFNSSSQKRTGLLIESGFVTVSTASNSFLTQGQLQLLQSKGGSEKTVIVTGLSIEYIRMFENLACNLKLVGGFDRLVAVAFDKETFTWGTANSISMIHISNVARADHTLPDSILYGTQAYKSITKLKSVAVLHILKAGYNVIFTDVDVVWFKNPYYALQEYWITDFVIQHDARSDSLRKFNSGLYGVRPTLDIISAFESIIDAARRSNSSEQPHFQTILCKNRTTHGNCMYRKTMIRVLPSETFPNGGWSINGSTFFKLGAESFTKLTLKPLYAVHNNWLSGIERKIRRQQEHHLWWTREQSCCSEIHAGC